MFAFGRPVTNRRRAAIGTVVVAMLSAVAVGAARPAAAAAPADSPGVLGTVPALLNGALDLGPLMPRPLDITMALPLRDQAGLDALIAAQNTPGNPQYHHYLSPDQFAQRFAPLPATVARVTGWATSSGLSNVSVSPNRTLVHMTGASSLVGNLLGMHLENFLSSDGFSYFSPSNVASLPARLAGSVVGVLGLSDLYRVGVSHTTDNVGTAANSAFKGYGPKEFNSFYNAPAPHPTAHRDGFGQTLAILAEGDLTQPRADLVQFENQFGLPHVPWTTVPVGNGPFTDTAGAPEWDLDTQYSTAFAPAAANLLVYQAKSLSDEDIVAEINKWVTDNRAAQASASFGECESLAHISGFAVAADQALAQAVAQGQTLFSSSGDTGSFCPLPLVSRNGLPVGLPGPNYPAASQYAVSVGGTTLTPDAKGGAHETAWMAGGGGIADFEPVPAWQANAGGQFLGINRGTPDVSLDADPASGYAVIVNGKQLPVGGTSASSPAWLGIWTRAQSTHGGALGFANPTLYSLPASAIHDITEGFQGLYMAGPGWDYTTGRGTPDIAALIAGLGGGAPAAAPAPPATSAPAVPVAPPALPVAPPSSHSSSGALGSITTLLIGTGTSGASPRGGLLGLAARGRQG
jgi:subtilase family serine protease